MNSSPVNLGEGGLLGELSRQALDFPRAYDVLTGMLNLPEMNDPVVGYGCLQGPAIWFQLDISNEDRLALLTLSTDDPELLYVILRAHSFHYWEDDETLMEAVRAPDFPWKKALAHVRKFIPNFGGKSVTRKIGGLSGKRNRTGRRTSRRTPKRK